MRRNERVYPIFLGISEAPIQKTVGSRHYAVGTQIQNIREATRDDSLKLQESVPILPARIPRLPWWHGVNWTFVIDICCIAAVIGCLIYLGVVVFGPFVLRFAWK